MEQAEVIYPKLVGEDFKNVMLPDVSEETYHGDRGSISSGAVRAVLKSKLHYKWEYILGRKKKATETMKFGSAVHLAILEPAKFRERFVVMPEFVGKTLDGRDSTQSKAAKEKRAEWLLSLPSDAVVMKQDEQDDLLFMVDHFLEKAQTDGVVKEWVSQSTLAARDLIRGAKFEQSGFFRDPVTGLRCRIRPDVFREPLDVLPDLKTARDVSRAGFGTACFDHGYDIQLGFYTYGVKQIFGKEPANRVFICIQNEAPYDLAVWDADDGFMGRGDIAVRQGLDLIHESITTGRFPGCQTNGIEKLGLPVWSDFRNDDERKKL